MKKIERPTEEVNIAISGKYIRLHDSYASIIEALTHSGAHLDAKVNIKWIETTEIENNKIAVDRALDDIHGVIVPGGFGTRGLEGKIKTIRYVRENNRPFLGICLGMQLAVIEIARDACNIKGANTTEVEQDQAGMEISDPVICILPSQKNIRQKGGTMRLGGQDVTIAKGTQAYDIYGSTSVRERFRHRYEVNPRYVADLEKVGVVFSGYEASENIKQIMELSGHPFFLGAQFHPELTSRLTEPAPLFFHFVKAALEYKKRGSEQAVLF